MTQTPRGRPLLLGTLAALSGFALFLSDFPVHAWPLQATALIPLLWGMDRHCASARQAILAGLCLGLAQIVPLAVALQFPLFMAAGLGLYLTLLWIAFAVGAHRALQRWPAPLGALGAGAVAAVVEWIDISLVPIWGTAQCYTRVWAAAPWTIQLVSLTGVTGLVFVLVTSQALVVKLVLHPGSRRRHALVLALLAAGVVLQGIWAWRQSPPGSLKVAAVGWTREDLESRAASAPLQTLDKIYRPLFQRAVRAGAKLVVSPEVGFFVAPSSRERLLRRLSDMAREHRVWLAVGYFHRDKDDNRIAFIDPRGELRAEYVKTHLIPFVERYRAGSGQTVHLPLDLDADDADPPLLGGMICQDDNFTDLARAYGRLKVALVAVPTNDWRQVKDYHLESGTFRAVENRYAVVRAASNGISAIISPRGEILARVDHFERGPEVIVAEVPLGRGGTLYSTAGEWFPLLCLLFLASAWGIGL
ncbi:MAG: apolipoprotein N-acyltransferase, partial [Planctomycetota bacterium]